MSPSPPSSSPPWSASGTGPPRRWPARPSSSRTASSGVPPSCSAANERLLQEIQERSEAQEHLSREEARAQRTHEIAEALQRSLLPDRLPQIPDMALAARYVPATADMEVGGDWYDVIQIRGGLIGLAIGDVAGHGPQAAATMGQLRMALRAYAVQDPSPVSVMSGVHQLVSHLPLPEMVTLMYLVFDPATRRLRFTNAGHPPPLVFGGGESRYLEGAVSPPLGVTADANFTETSLDLGRGRLCCSTPTGSSSVARSPSRSASTGCFEWPPATRPRTSTSCATTSCPRSSSRTTSPTTSPSWPCVRCPQAPARARRLFPGTSTRSQVTPPLRAVVRPGGPWTPRRGGTRGRTARRRPPAPRRSPAASSRCSDRSRSGPRSAAAWWR